MAWTDRIDPPLDVSNPRAEAVETLTQILRDYRAPLATRNMLRLMQQPGLSGEEYGEFATAIESWLNRYQSYTQLEESYHGFHLLKRSAPSQAFLDAKSAATLLAKLGPLEKDSLYAAAEDVRGRHTDKSPWAR